MAESSIDPLSRMSAGIGFGPAQSSSPEGSRSPAGQEQQSANEPAAGDQDAQLQAILEQSRLSAEAEAARRAQREDDEFQRVLQLSQSSEEQRMSEAERQAQEERDLLEALQESTRGQERDQEELEHALNGSSASPLFAPVASGSGLGPGSLESAPDDHTGVHSAHRTPTALATDAVPSPSLSSPHSNLSLHSLSPRSSVYSTRSSARITSRPLPLPPNGNRRQPCTLTPSPPASVHSQSTAASPQPQKPSATTGRLLNPFEDQETLNAPARWPSTEGGIPYVRPSVSLDHAPEPEHLQTTPDLSSSNRQSYISDFASFNDSMSTLELGSSNGHSTAFSIPEEEDEVERLQEDEHEQVHGVKIGFPRLSALSSGRIFPEVVQISRSEEGLETFSIETKSYRSLMTYLCWNADCSIISDHPVIIESKASVAFEFFEGAHAPSLRMCVTLDSLDPHAKPSPPAPTHHTEDFVVFRTEVSGMINLPITAFALAKELQTIQKSARLCCERGGGNLYELGQEIDKLARRHGEKGPGSEEPDVQESCNRLSRLRKKLGRRAGVETASHIHHKSSSSTNGAIRPLSPKSGGRGPYHRKFARLRAAASSSNSSLHRLSASGRDESDVGATELRDEAFFVTPFHLPRT